MSHLWEYVESVESWHFVTVSTEQEYCVLISHRVSSKYRYASYSTNRH